MISNFTSKFTNEKIDCIKVRDAYYVIPAKLLEINIGIKQESMGLFLGENKGNKFYPSLALLEKISPESNEKIIVKDIGEMDYIYGKNLRQRHIKNVLGETKVGFLKLVVNERDECLGYGKIVKPLNEKGVVFKNILDRGDYLRREKV
ncbi:MAG: hypothetical protein U9Q69_06175 [Nanoarchaeota archaeon]|nr:hypothetical protein [Nanoarchaeota archaeon]